MIVKYTNHFSILPMFTPIDYNIIGNTNGLSLNYYWIIVQNVFFLNDSVFLISIWI